MSVCATCVGYGYARGGICWTCKGSGSEPAPAEQSPVEGERDDAWWDTVIGKGKAHEPSGELRSIKHMHPLMVKPIYDAHRGTAVADMIAGFVFSLSIQRNRERYLVDDANERATKAEAELEALTIRSVAVSPEAVDLEWTDEAIVDLIGDAISDSMDMDWTSTDGAKAVLAALHNEGLLRDLNQARKPEGAEPVAWRRRANANHPILKDCWDLQPWRAYTEKEPELAPGLSPDWFDVQPLYAHPAHEAGEVDGAARFLLDRLTDFENRISTDDDGREFYGHVSPAAARLRAALNPKNTERAQ